MAGSLMYLLTSIISYLGVIGGFALANISPEELKPGRKYFDAVMDFTFIILMLLLLYFRNPAIGVIIIIAIGVYLKFGRGMTAMKIEYGILGVVFALLAADQLMFKIAASLVFIFGLAGGTLCVMKHQEKSRAWQFFYVLFSNSLFFVTALPLYFLDVKIVP